MQVNPIGRYSENSKLLGFLRASVVNFESFERGWSALERGDHHGANAPLWDRPPEQVAPPRRVAEDVRKSRNLRRVVLRRREEQPHSDLAS